MLRPPIIRKFATAAHSAGILDRAPAAYNIFDRNVKRIQKDRAASRDGRKRSRTVDYLRDNAANNMIERLMDIKRTFSHIVDIGSGPGHLTRLLDSSIASRATMVDLSKETLHRDLDDEFDVPIERIHLDEESLRTLFKPSTIPGVVSCLSLHWTNDLPGVLSQICEILQPDGVFMGAMFGADTLFELRTSLQLAETEREGGISIRVSPMTDTRDVSNLLSRAGFTLTTVDIDDITVAYPSMFELLEDLRDMGESNAVIERRPFLRRDTLAAASSIYKELHARDDGSIPATFQIIYMIGWRPAPGQTQPLERGSGKTNLNDIL